MARRPTPSPPSHHARTPSRHPRPTERGLDGHLLRLLRPRQARRRSPLLRDLRRNPLRRLHVVRRTLRLRRLVLDGTLRRRTSRIRLTHASHPLQPYQENPRGQSRQNNKPTARPGTTDRATPHTGKTKQTSCQRSRPAQRAPSAPLPRKPPLAGRNHKNQRRVDSNDKRDGRMPGPQPTTPPATPAEKRGSGKSRYQPNPNQENRYSKLLEL